MATVAILLHGHSVSIRLCVCLVNLISAFSLIETPQYNFGLCTDNTRARITLGRNTTARVEEERAQDYSSDSELFNRRRCIDRNKSLESCQQVKVKSGKVQKYNIFAI